VCVAGIESFGVMNVILSRVKRNPRRFPGKSKVRFTEREWSREQLDVYVGGLQINGDDERNDRHVDWLRRRIKPGDRIVVRVLSSGRFDPPRGAGRRLTARRSRTRAKAARAARRGR
jgi:hypothetical protein